MRGTGRAEGPAILNKTLMIGIPYYRRVCVGKEHFSNSLPLLVLVKNMSLWNPSVDLACAGGGVHSMADTPGDG